MALERITKIYDGPGGPFEGVVAIDTEWTDPKPGVMVRPNILGQKEAGNIRAEELGRLGYVGFAIDVYGQGKRTTLESPERGKYVDELDADRGLLRGRLNASLA